MAKLLLSILLAILIVDAVWSDGVLYGHEEETKNHVKNWDFEEDISSSDWTLTAGVLASKVSGGYTGEYSLLITNRTGNETGVRQKIYTAEAGLKKDTNYYMSAWIKLLDEGPDDDPYVNVAGLVKVKVNTGGEDIILSAGALVFLLDDHDWMQLGQDVKMPSVDFEYVEYYIRVEPSIINYQIDTVAFSEIPKYSDWREHFNQETTKNRKSNVTITGSFRADMDLSETTVQVELKRHEFGFGMACDAKRFNGKRDLEQRYRNFILDTFNWGGFENDVKWKPMEKVEGRVRFARVDSAIETMNDYNMTIRGHSLTWGVKKTNPKWVQSLTGEALKTAVESRVEYCAKHFKGQIFEYDVYNEYLHGHFFEDEVHDPHMIEYMFNKAHEVDPDADLCLNDYQIARGGKLASNQANLARHLLKKNIPVHCIGIQSHLKTLPIDPEALERRIAINSAVGLPLSITEFSAHSENVSVRADGLEVAFRVYFANPGVRSITLWDFGDQFGPGFSTTFYLFEGDQLTPNAAGDRFLDLMEEWTTLETYTPTSSSFSETLSGFIGNYMLTVTTAGEVELEQEFYIGKGDNSVTFSV